MVLLADIEQTKNLLEHQYSITNIIIETLFSIIIFMAHKCKITFVHLPVKYEWYSSSTVFMSWIYFVTTSEVHLYTLNLNIYIIYEYVTMFEKEHFTAYKLIACHHIIW